MKKSRYGFNWLSVDQVARKLECSKYYVYKYITDGTLPCRTVEKHRVKATYLIHKVELQEFIESNDWFETGQLEHENSR